MRPPFRHLIPLIILLLIACGGAQQSATPTAAPIALTAAPVQTATIAATATGTSLFAAIPQSETPEGYHVLGNPQAPVTLVMYSDFL